MDLHDADDMEIDQQWCVDRISETTFSSGDAQRRNYVFLHKMLYPVFSDAPQSLIEDPNHQYLAFVQNDQLDRTYEHLKLLKDKLELPENDVSIGKVRLNPNAKSSVSMFENEGGIAGADWRSFNSEQYLRIKLRRPMQKTGALYLFHIVMSKILTLHSNALVGYKYAFGERDRESPGPIWIRRKWTQGNKTPTEHRILPKHVSEPVQKIIEIVKLAK